MFLPYRTGDEEVSDPGYPIGALVENWQAPPYPKNLVLHGQHVTLVPLSADHAEPLWLAYSHDADHRGWRYMHYGPFADCHDFRIWLESQAGQDDPYFFSVLDNRTHTPTGMASYLRIFPDAGSIEVGHIHFSPLLQRTTGATEAMYLMMQWVFESGYRRYEWKCNALNAPSRRAAERLGFRHEGIFRQSMVVKGRNRDTAWYAVIDQEWPALQSACRQWLDASNFDDNGQQRLSLSALMRLLSTPNHNTDGVQEQK